MLSFPHLSLLVGSMLLAVAVHAQPVRFFAIGDVPYSDGEVVYLRALLEDASAERPPFMLHIGDIKGGSQPCSDARIQGVAELFRAQSAPFLYTPGDNEWTDCHRQRAGARDPLERLAVLRQIVFADATVLHNGALQPVVPDPAYPENLYFGHEGVLVVLMHVVGSNNNFKPKNAAAMAEFEARAAANRALLERAAAAADAMQARALVLAFHANPLFEGHAARRGFVPVKQDLRQLLSVYAGPVLLIHGDTHRFRLDHPLADADGRRIERFSRLEVPGSPFVAGVWVTVDADATPVFDAEVVYPNALLRLGDE
jgi:hypothetical protein